MIVLLIATNRIGAKRRINGNTEVVPVPASMKVFANKLKPFPSPA